MQSAGTSADGKPGVALASQSRAATGDVTAHGGARRVAGDQAEALRNAIDSSGAKNVILLIGDGMGDSEITLARNYRYGAGGMFPGIDALPLTGQYTHYSLDKETSEPNYVTDSSASGTAWSTGTKTYNGAVSVDIHGQPQRSILELAKDAGMATGDVSTAEIEDATPAVQYSHVSDRGCYGPDEMAETCPEASLGNGGPGSIAEQLLTTRPDVTLGGGAETFAQQARAGEYAGMTLFDQAEQRGFNVVRNADELAAVDAAGQDRPLLGLFTPGNMPVRLTGDKATQGGIDLPAQECRPNPERDTSSVPDLATMTDTALDLLSTDEDGFFLQVEGASIDKQDHAADPCGQIGETVDLDEAVRTALDFAEADGDTLVIVTADHAHTSQIVATDTESPALTSKLLTADGAPMGVLYGTGEADAPQGHTGTQLRVAAYGPGADGVLGLTDQTDLFYTITGALGLPTGKR